MYLQPFLIIHITEPLFLIELNKILTEDLNFIENQNNSNTNFTPTIQTREKLLKFQGDHQFRFNELILLTNNSTVKKL